VTEGTRPRFSIVTAVYDVEAYLPAFIRSVERQRIDRAQVEVVAVDDGSTDGSRDLLLDWARRGGGRVRVLTKPNGGQASARNLGLQHARGEWVTFPDPDDVLDPDYLRAADRFAKAHPGVEVMSARPVLFHEASGLYSRGHPRRWQYADGNRTANLVDEPSVFLGVTPGSFFRLDRIAAGALRFDERIRPNFEDAHFAVRYLLDLPEPVVGLLHDSVYVYRKRAAGTSTLQGSMRHPGRYSDVLKLGYLDVLERGRAPDGSIATWIQQLIVYELSWYLSEDEKITASIDIPPELAPRFHELLDELLARLDPNVVERHGARRLNSPWFDLLARARRGQDWHTPYVVRSRRDRAMGLRRFHYRFVGARPAEAFRAGGRATEPAFQKTMAHRYFGRDFLSERILWLPDVEDLEIELDGQLMDHGWAWPRPTAERRPVPGRRRTFGRRVGDRLWVLRRQPRRRLVAALARRVRRVVRRATSAPVRVAARTRPFRQRFRDAWVLMDRIHDADDNGERLFEYLRAERPDINAWFVIERGTPDWERLRALDPGRVVAHGSWAWKMLMLNCAWLVSSHVDLPIARPPAIVRIRREPQWRLVFAQHGVTKDDLSRWLNHRELDLFTVSTEAELASVAGDGTAYRFTTKETRNTGLPRFDRLLAKGRAVAEEDRDLVIVAPTWRQWLTLPLASGSQRRALDAAFWESEYVRSWLAVLTSERVAEAIAERGWRLGFMPHPNLQGMLPALHLPGHVEPLSFAGTDVQALYARCALLVTDYSSVAFNTAYLDRPLVYFQFDRAAMLGGAHVGRAGYFDYGRDGFGPVVEDVPAAEAAIVAAVRHGPRPTPEYQARIDRTFPNRDGQACARVVAAIEDLSRPWTPAAATGAERAAS
jgi:glycosyltransferase involved in cell wall biosynthesis